MIPSGSCLVVGSWSLDLAEPVSMVEPVQVTAPAPAPAPAPAASTVVNKQEDLARHPAEKARVDSAVASPSTVSSVVFSSFHVPFHYLDTFI